MKLLTPISRLGLLLALAWATSPTALFAQDPAAETLQQRVGLPTQVASPTTPVKTDEDLGEISVVQKAPVPETFTFSTSQQFFYTDNVFFTDVNPVGSTAYLGSYTASFVPYSLRDWTPRVAVQYNMVRYGSVASGDFDNENISLSSQYVFSKDRSWTWTASVNAARFTAPHANDHEFYKEFVYDNQISHVEKLSKTLPLFFVAAYDLAYHQANPADFDRLDNILSFSLVYYPLPSVSISSFVRPASRDYFTNTANQTDRTDFNLSEGLDVTWQPWKYASLSADFTHTNDYSSSTHQSYNESSPGVSVTGTVKF